MHIANSCANDIEHMKTINRVKSGNSHLNRFLSASARSSLSSLIILQKTLPADLTLNVMLFSSSRNAVSNYYFSTCTFPFQNLSSHYVVGIRLFHRAPVRNTVKKRAKFLATSPRYDPIGTVVRLKYNWLM